MPWTSSGSGRHRSKPSSRPVEHRLSGGGHRDRSGCLAVALLILAVPVGALSGAAGALAVLFT